MTSGSIEDVDRFGDGEDGAISSDADGHLTHPFPSVPSSSPAERRESTDRSDEDEHGFINELSLSEQTQSEIDEDEILAQLG